MLLHIMDQPELVKGEGPIAVIVAPTRELSEQIHKQTRIFSKPYGQHCWISSGTSMEWLLGSWHLNEHMFIPGTCHLVFLVSSIVLVAEHVNNHAANSHPSKMSVVKVIHHKFGALGLLASFPALVCG